MAVYAVQGKLGTGKTKFCVWMAKQAMFYGRRVAGNLDIKLEKLSPRKPGRYVRIPDKPTAFDLDAIGHGNPNSYDESRNGVLILDELGTWLNSRSFQDKNRVELLDWLIHARKKGWDVYLIVQDVVMIDKQVREALVEYSCNCIRLDKVRIPFVGWFLAYIGSNLNAIIGTDRFRKLGYLPFFHLVVARIGQGVNSVVAERWAYTAKDLHDAYDTRQIFRTDYEHGAYSALPPWDYSPPRSFLSRWLGGFTAASVDRAARRAVLRPARPLPAAVALIMKLPDRDERVRLLRRWCAFIDQQDLCHPTTSLMPLAACGEAQTMVARLPTPRGA
jgi:hypothetical protein